MPFTEQPSILIIDDDEISAALISRFLSEKYSVNYLDNGQTALNLLPEIMPDLILLDVCMPGLSGYEVCKSIRNIAIFAELPIIFLSALISEEDRLSGYAAGGNDYLTKPVSAGELSYKIELAMQRLADHRRLKADFHDTFATAMTAMNTAAEIGAILQFLQASFTCENYNALCHEIINTLSGYGLIGSVQIRGKLGTASLSTEGSCSPLEESVLNNLFGHARLFEFSSCLSCSFDHVIVIVKNLDRSDTGRQGRMRDNIALLAEGANVRIIALDKAQELTHKNSELHLLIAHTRDALQYIEQQQREQFAESSLIFRDLQAAFEDRLFTLGLTEKQEDDLSQMIQNTATRALALYDKGVSTETFMENIVKKLTHPLS